MSGGDDGNENNGCFAADSLVLIMKPDGEIVPKLLGEVKVGDKIESVDTKTGLVTFSDVCFIQHDDDPNPCKDVLELSYFSEGLEGTLVLTPNHLLYFNKAGSEPESHPLKHPVCAGKCEVGDFLWVKNASGKFSPCRISAITKKNAVRVINPITVNHNVVVSGVHASCHVVNEKLYRMITRPLRMIYAVKPALCTSRPLKSFNRLFYKKSKNPDGLSSLPNNEIKLSA